jgi:hypothetical protein
VNRAAAHLVEHPRQLASQVGDTHALRSLVFTVAEAFDAIAAQRGTRLLEVQTPAIDLGKICDNVGNDGAFTSEEKRDVREKLRVGDGREVRHSSRITR